MFPRLLYRAFPAAVLTSLRHLDLYNMAELDEYLYFAIDLAKKVSQDLLMVRS